MGDLTEEDTHYFLGSDSWVCDLPADAAFSWESSCPKYAF